MSFFSILFLTLIGFSKPLSLSEFLDRVQKSNKSFQMIENQKQAAQLRYGATDLPLSPVVSVSSKYTDDQMQRPVTPTFTVNRQKSREHSVSLAKKIGATGTTASVTALMFDASQDISTPIPASASFATGGAIVTLSQSLWKDAFGYGTRRRHEKETHLSLLEQASVDLQKSQLLIEAENSYWDLIYASKDLEIKQASLERARKLEKWMRQRVSNGISEKADLLGTQSLVATRDLQVQISQDEFLAVKERAADFLEIPVTELMGFEDDLVKERALSQQVANPLTKNSKPLRYDAFLSSLESKAKRAGALEAADSVRPELTLEGLFKTNQLEANIDEVRNKLTQSERPTASVGIKFTWLLDADSKDSVSQTAQLEALASQNKSDRKNLESETSWSELNRRHKEMTKKITTAETIALIQGQRAAAERDRLQKGRSVTSNVLTAEQDAEEAELTLNKLKVERRKLEAQAKLFLNVEN